MTSKRILALSLVAAVSGVANASPITPGDLLVLQTGLNSGQALQSNKSTPGYINEYDPNTGTLVQQIPIPYSTNPATTTGPGYMTFSGQATSDGTLIYSNGFVTFAGYSQVPGIAKVTSSTAAANHRVVGILAMDGTLDLSTHFAAFDVSNIRGAYTTDGTNLLVWGAAKTGATDGGIRFTTKGATTTSNVTDPTLSFRRIGVYGGQLYADNGGNSTPTGGPFMTVGSGIPTTSGQTTTLVPGFPQAGVPYTDSLGQPQTNNPSPFNWHFVDANTLYVADDRMSDQGGGVGGGLQKWTFNGSIWVLQYTMNTGLPLTPDKDPVTGSAFTQRQGIRGLVYMGKDGNGNNMFVVTTASQTVPENTDIYKVTDSGPLSTFNFFLTPPTNCNFRGIVRVPVQTGVTLAGNLTLGNYTLAGTVPAQFKIYSGGVLKSTVTSNVTVNSSGVGTYSINAGSVSGSIDVYCVINGGTFLQKKNTVSVSGTSASSDFSLINGDIDGNNIVNINDYSVLSDHFNAPAGDPNYVANADLDKNGTININDYSILSDNFNLAGDVAP